ncbi:hypothetical protein [Bdellovibrio sp. HCB-110]|uniref:hypothetical protein n=1 Tax=Bdellovibrio sp. HCB-110 TaxID=3391182 RepID=UPI0039B42F5B
MVRLISKLLNVTVAILSILTFASCTPASSPLPSSEELIKTEVPTFDGSENYSTTTSTTSFVLLGGCDQKSYGLEYSYDGTSWMLLMNDCATGRFSIHLVVRSVLNVYVRAKTKMGHTAAARATVRFVLPPTSPSFQIVSSGNSVEDIDRKIQFTSSIAGEEGHYTSPTMNLQTGVTGITYGP